MSYTSIRLLMLKKTTYFFKKLFPYLFLILLTVLIFVIIKSYNYFPKREIKNNLTKQVNQSEEEKISLPDNFPRDFPIFPNSNLVTVKQAKNKLEGISAVWETNKKTDEITSFYLEELNSRNWKVETISQKQDSVTLFFVKEKIQGVLGIAKTEEKKVIITIALAIK